jgi:hypothetical protein
VNITGGVVGDFFHVFPGSQVFVTGGTIGDRFSLHPGSQVHLFGAEFFLNGQEVSGGRLGEALVIALNDGSVTGKLADGSPITVNPYQSIGGPATLTVTLVSLLKGDYNSNGTVEQADLDLVLLNWGEELFNPFGAGWINDIPSGVIDQEELDNVLLHWGSTPAPVGTAGIPEPATSYSVAVLASVLLFARALVVRRQMGPTIF